MSPGIALLLALLLAGVAVAILLYAMRLWGRPHLPPDESTAEVVRRALHDLEDASRAEAEAELHEIEEAYRATGELTDEQARLEALHDLAARYRSRPRRGSADTVWAILAAAFALLVVGLCLAGCAPKMAPPDLFSPLEPYEEPEPYAVPPPSHPCPLDARPSMTYQRGQPPPFVADGLVTCTALLVDADFFGRLLYDAETGGVQAGYRASCELGRKADRAICTAEVGRLQAELRIARRENDGLRIAVVVGVTGGTLLGAVLGWSLARLLMLTLPLGGGGG